MRTKRITNALVVGTLALSLSLGGLAPTSADLNMVTVANAASYDYSVATDKSVKEVETFAKKVKKLVLNKQWKMLSEYVAYPVLVNGKEINSQAAFIEKMNTSKIRKGFLKAIKKESCKKMFARDTGIMFGNGEIWFSELDGELKVITLNCAVQSKTSSSVKKPTSIKWGKAKENSDAAGVKAKWKAVKGAAGYQCKFFLMWPENKKTFTKKNVKTNNCSIYFQDNEDIKLMVRAYKNVNGKKVYSKWATSIIDDDKVEALVGDDD